VKMCDGITIYTVVFHSAGNQTVPGIIAWDPYGKEIGGQWLDDVLFHSGLSLSKVSELQKFEAPDLAYWWTRVMLYSTLMLEGILLRKKHHLLGPTIS
jgi:predicted acyl esterase